MDKELRVKNVAPYFLAMPEARFDVVLDIGEYEARDLGLNLLAYPSEPEDALQVKGFECIIDEDDFYDEKMARLDIKVRNFADIEYSDRKVFEEMALTTLKDYLKYFDIEFKPKKND